MKFAADKMLGRLSRWLRVIGQDVTYGPHLSGYGLIREARREGRLILTRDRGLTRKNPPDYLLIQSDQFREQLKQVVQACRLEPFKEAFSRCVECNTLLVTMARGAVMEKVPLYLLSTQKKFSLCPTCRRVYWPASRAERKLLLRG